MHAIKFTTTLGKVLKSSALYICFCLTREVSVSGWMRGQLQLSCTFFGGVLLHLVSMKKKLKNLCLFVSDGVKSIFSFYIYPIYWHALGF